MEKINIAEILKDCPSGTKLYSPFFGQVELLETCSKGVKIMIDPPFKDICVWLNADGTYKTNECMLFPSKDQRDWSKFVKPVKPPFEIKRAKIENHYYYLRDVVCVGVTNELAREVDNSMYEFGNYFNTNEQAQYAAEKVRELLLSLRKEAGNE